MADRTLHRSRPAAPRRRRLRPSAGRVRCWPGSNTMSSAPATSGESNPASFQPATNSRPAPHVVRAARPAARSDADPLTGRPSPVPDTPLLTPRRWPPTLRGDDARTPVLVGPSAEVEVRPADLPRRDPHPVAGLAGGEPRTERGVWLCSWRAATGRPVCPYPEAVEEAICFGWIDATVNVLDDDRALQLMTRRKPKSTWTRLNRRRVEALEAAGLMTDAGRRAVAVARQNGWWTIYEPVEALVEPPDLVAALDASPRRECDGTGSLRAPRRPCCGGSSARRRTTPGSGGSSRSSPRPSPANEPRDDHSTYEGRGRRATVPRRPLRTPAIAPRRAVSEGKRRDRLGRSTNVTADAAASASIARLGSGAGGHPPECSDGSRAARAGKGAPRPG